MSWYRLHVDQTYSKAVDASMALSAIDATLAAHGRGERGERKGRRVTVMVERVDSAHEATALHDALTSDWAIGTRTAGTASVVLRDESSA